MVVYGFLPSPRWGEGLGVRGAAPSDFATPARPDPLPRKAGGGEKRGSPSLARWSDDALHQLSTRSPLAGVCRCLRDGMLFPMKTYLRALGALVLLAATAQAADPVPGKPVDTTFLKQYAETRGFMLGRPQKPKITPDGKTVLFLRADAKTPKLKLFEFDVASGKTKELLSPEMLLKGAEENLTPEEKARRERQRVSVGGFTDYHLDTDGTHILVMLSGKLYVFDRATGEGDRAEDRQGRRDRRSEVVAGRQAIAYVRGFDVYVYDLAAGKESAVTTGGTRDQDARAGRVRRAGGDGPAQRLLVAPGLEVHRLRGGGPHRRRDVVRRRPAEAGREAAPSSSTRGRARRTSRCGSASMPVEGGETVWVEWDRKKYEYLAAVEWDEVRRADDPGAGPQAAEVAAALSPTRRPARRRSCSTRTDPAWVNLSRTIRRVQLGAGRRSCWLGPVPDGDRRIELRGIRRPARRHVDARRR